VCDRVGVPKGTPKRVIHESVRVKPKLPWTPKEVGDAMNCGTSAKESHRKRTESAQHRDHVGCNGKAMEPWYPSTLELTSCHCVPQISNMKLQDLKFSLLDFNFSP
jgi:hypothetical protein